MAFGIAPGGLRRRRRRKHGAMAEINVTPLVDVMLVLLIIFMVTAPLLTAGVPIELPDSRANALPQAPKEIAITMTADGRTYLDRDEIAPGELADRLASIAPADGSKPPLVTLRADRALSYGEVVEVMGELNHAGFNSISLVTDGSVQAP